MSLEIRLSPASPSGQRLAVEVRLRCVERVQIDLLAVVGLCSLGRELGPQVLVPLPGALAGERCVQVRLCVARAVPAQVRCTAWVAGSERPVVVLAPVCCTAAYPGLAPELAACLDEVQIEHCETSFGVFLEDFCDGLDPGLAPFDEVEEAVRQLMIGEE